MKSICSILKGIFGIVSELGTADKKYSLPLKVAAGNRANAIVVDNVDTAKDMRINGVLFLSTEQEIAQINDLLFDKR